ncbi:MAG TPA: hypothetical protein VNW06_10210 [Cytophagaceae bacterium]|jgi:hypothetical protein|nr:hypothetical protein [Cytophagaceae bacterium]
MYTGLISFEGGIANKQKAGLKELCPKPYLKISTAKDSVTIEFDMDFQESILIYCKRGNETDFVLLTETGKSPFRDTRSNLTEYSETREYKAIFCRDKESIGEEDFIKVKTKGRFRFF